MSPLAFDKQGKPFAWHKRREAARAAVPQAVRARHVLSGARRERAPLYVDADIDYGEFRRAVGRVPGLYRLDQCDEDGNGLEDEPPAYVSIEQLRNAAASPTRAPAR